MFTLPNGYRLVSGVDAYKKLCLCLNVYESRGWIRCIGLDSPECLYALPDENSIQNSLIASINTAPEVANAL